MAENEIIERICGSCNCDEVTAKEYLNDEIRHLNGSTRFGRTIPPYQQMLQAMRMTMQEHRQRSMPTSYITSIVGKVATIKDSMLLRL